MTRHLCLALALLTLSLGGVAQAQAPSKERAAADYEWVFHYYMAYDNNLEKCGQPIIKMLKQGITSDKVVVVVTADFRNDEGMQRYVLTKDDQKMTQLSEEGCAEEEVLAAELDWVSKNFSAKRYAVVFLNHGGRLGEMSYDERPGKKGGQKWLFPPEVGTVMTKWRKSLAGECELFFYQQCGKGTLENYHAVKDAAKFVMGSQTVVGAPNYYYTKFLKDVCATPDLTGKEIAALITKHETPNMFTTYSTFDCEALGDLPKKLDAVLKPLVALETVKLPRGRKDFKPCFDFKPDETMFDAFAFLDGMYAANGLDTAPLEAFKAWSKETMMTGHRVSEQQVEKAGSWCGYSLYFPMSRRALTRYTESYPIYRETQLDEFLHKVIDTIDVLRKKLAERRRAAAKKAGARKR